MASYSWNTTDGDLNDPSNWTPSGLPGAGDTASFGNASGTLSQSGGADTLAFLAGGNWSLAGQEQSGNVSILGTLTIQSGGVLTATSGVIAVGNAAGGTGALLINAGGQVTSVLPMQTAINQLSVANYAGSTGVVSVAGSGALLDLGANGAEIGNVGVGNLTVSGGGVARIGASFSTLPVALIAGGLAGSQGTVGVSGSGSQIVAVGPVYLGLAGSATLRVDNGGVFAGGNSGSGISIGSGVPSGTGTAAGMALNGGSGRAIVDGSGSLLHSLTQIQVGFGGTAGSLVVSNGGSVKADSTLTFGGGALTGGNATVTVQSGGTITAGGTHAGAGISIGNSAGSSGQVTATDGGSALDANGDRLVVGGAGSGVLTISGGARALAGSAGYTDVEAALAVAATSTSTGVVTIIGAGSQLVATGDGVIGGTERGAGAVAGGAGSVSVSAGGTLSVSGTLTIQASGTLTVDASSTLIAPTMTINGGTASLGVLTSATAVSFGEGGLLAVTTVSGTNTIGNFTFGDTIDVGGAASLSGSVVTTSSGTIALGTAPAHASFQMFADGHGGELVALTPQTIGVSRFFDTSLGTHFFTADAGEAAAILATRPDLVPEGPGGIGLQAVSVSANDPNAVQVFRFFDTIHGTHFYTASSGERDSIIATRSDLTYEASSSFYEHATAQTGDTAVYRYFDSVNGTHFYTDSASERATIAASRPDLVSEGVGFYEPHQNYMT